MARTFPETDMKTTIYVYLENTVRRGKVYLGENPEANGDVFLFGEGTEEELIAHALDRLARRYDRAGAGDSFAWKCALNVLDFLGGPEVELDSATRTYHVVPAACDD